MAEPSQKTRIMAVFCDFENVALGAQDAKYDKFDISKVLERLLLKGLIVVKKAYCDWDRYRSFKRGMHEAAFELIEIPHVRMSGKNSADIRMVVDALDLCYTKEHVDTFVIISGDSDFSPLVSKLRENNKTVIGLGVKNSTSDIFLSNCDEFIFYDDLVRNEPSRRPLARKTSSGPVRKTAGRSTSVPRPVESAKDETRTTDEPREKEETAIGNGNGGGGGKPSSGDPDEGIRMVLETADALRQEREGAESIWGSMVKQTLKRRNPGFNERFFGFRSFNALLEAARDRGLIKLTHDDKSGGYMISTVKENGLENEGPDGSENLS